MGSFDTYSDQMLFDGVRTGRPPATFGESFGWGFDVGKTQLPFAAHLQFLDKTAARAKTIRDVTGNDRLYLDLINTPADPRHAETIDALAKTYPGYVKTDDQLREEVKAQNAKTREDAAFALQETTTGGTFGGFLGGAAAGVLYDPVLWATLPMGASVASGILRRALVEVGINAGAEVASMAVSASWRKRMGDPITGDEFALRMLMVTGVGGVVGAGTGLLLKLSRARGAIVAAEKRALPAAERRIIDLTEADRLVIDLTEGDRLLNQAGRGGQFDPFNLRTVGEAQQDIARELELRDLQLRDPQAFEALKAEYRRLDPTESRLQLENVLLEQERFIAAKLEEQRTLPRSATSRQRAALAKEIEDATFYQENLDDMFRRDAEFARTPDPYPYVTQAERDAAHVLDDINAAHASNPYEQPATFRNHVTAIGKVINDVDAERRIDVDGIVNRAVQKADGTWESPRLREDLRPKGVRPAPPDGFAYKLKDGTIVSDPAVRGHLELAQKYGINPDDIDPEGSGFVVDGKFVKSRGGTEADPVKDAAIRNALRRQIEDDVGGPDDFPKSPQPKMAEAQIDSQWDEASAAWRKEYDDLLASKPDSPIGDLGKAREIIDAMEIEESELAAVRACLTGGGSE